MIQRGNKGGGLLMSFKLLSIVTVLCWSSCVSAAWTPLITSENFTGVQTDVLTAGTGVLSIAVIILGLVFIIRTMTGR